MDFAAVFPTSAQTHRPGIYAFINVLNERMYVGRSTDIARRWYEHTSLLRRKVNGCKLLQRAWNKYGADNFHFVVLEYIDRK